MRTKKLELGDHVCVEYNWFTHHGIYSGNDKIIHNSREAGNVTVTTLADFARGRPVWIILKEACYPPEVIVKRARAQLGKRAYHLIADNCEHFARWCQTGQSKSEQILKWAAIVAPFTGGLSLWFPIAAEIALTTVSPISTRDTDTADQTAPFAEKMDRLLEDLEKMTVETKRLTIQLMSAV